MIRTNYPWYEPWYEHSTNSKVEHWKLVWFVFVFWLWFTSHVNGKRLSKTSITNQIHNKSTKSFFPGGRHLMSWRVSFATTLFAWRDHAGVLHVKRNVSAALVRIQMLILILESWDRRVLTLGLWTKNQGSWWESDCLKNTFGAPHFLLKKINNSLVLYYLVWCSKSVSRLFEHPLLSSNLANECIVFAHTHRQCVFICIVNGLSLRIGVFGDNVLE